TSGVAGVFPKDLPVGRISRVTRRTYGLFQEVEVIPAVDFSALEEMLVSCRAFGMEAFEIQPFGEPSRPAGLVRLRAVKGGGRRRLRLLPQRPLPGSGSGGAE
ncbi:MAG TPA: rod shape-determining protein MreC, partial [Candidatus Fermentibacter sp.]|nr:rod shape-determining protein MreC [Candidatus Fermentibacter sp.]